MNLLYVVITRDCIDCGVMVTLMGSEELGRLGMRERKDVVFFEQMIVPCMQRPLSCRRDSVMGVKVYEVPDGNLMVCGEEVL